MEERQEKNCGSALCSRARRGRSISFSPLGIALVLALFLPLSPQTSARSQDRQAADAPERFDMAVRGDMFTGMAGDRAELSGCGEKAEGPTPRTR